MIPTDAGRVYEEWRGHWLRGRESHAIQALRFHGLRTALELPGRERPRRPTSTPVVATGLPVGEALVAEAARQLRRLVGGAIDG